MLVFPKLNDISSGQQPEAVVVPGQGSNGAVCLDDSRLHPPVVKSALAARWNVGLVIYKKTFETSLQEEGLKKYWYYRLINSKGKSRNHKIS